MKYFFISVEAVEASFQNTVYGVAEISDEHCDANCYINAYMRAFYDGDYEDEEETPRPDKDGWYSYRGTTTFAKCNFCREITKTEYVILNHYLTHRDPGELPAIVPVLKCALSDLKGIMPQLEPNGERKHPGWTTIREIENLLNVFS